jgi:hypothetical protein
LGALEFLRAKYGLVSHAWLSWFNCLWRIMETTFPISYSRLASAPSR